MNTKLFLATTGNGIAPALPYGDGEWSIELPLTEQDVRCLASDPLNADVIYAGTGVTASCARMIVVKPGSVVAWMVKSSKSHRLDCSFHSADCAVPPRNGISGDLLKLPVDFRHPNAILIKSNFSKSQESRECPKIGVRAYARTPIFGLLTGNSWFTEIINSHPWYPSSHIRWKTKGV